MRARALLACVLLAAGACDEGFRFDDGFCDRHPGDPACPASAGSAGVSGSGGGGAAGASGDAGGGGAAGLGGDGSGGQGGLVCTAPTTNCGGACVNVAGADAANCGACGRSCLGAATCAKGACVPEAMATGEVAPYALVDDGTSLYWVSPAVKSEVGFIPRMRRVAKASAGGLATNAFASTIVRARSLGFAAGKLFWGDLGANPSDTNQRLVSAAPTDLGPQLIEADQLNVQHLALAGGKVYWSLLGGASVVRGKLLTAGSGVFDPEITGQNNPTWVVVDGDAVPYWVANAGGGQREVRRTTSPNSAEPVASGQDVVAVELAGERFYWADGAAVRSRPKATPTEAPRDEFSGQGAVEGFAVSVAGAGGAGGAGGSNGAGGAGGAGGVGPSGVVTLYALTVQGRQLKAWRKGPDDNAPRLLGEVEAKAPAYTGNPFGAAHVLVDGSYLYFADVGTVDTNQVVPVSQGDGVVYRVAK